MFYRVQVEDHVRVPPTSFNLPKEEAIISMLEKQFEGFISKDLGIVISVSQLLNVHEGVIIPDDGAAFYKCTFELLTLKPELQEIVSGKVRDIADFGAFLNIGAIDGMIHISQTMDDFVSFSKEKVLVGKASTRSLKVGDLCRARIIAISYKDVANPKLGLTMRQPGLGKLEWLTEDEKPKEEPKKKETKKIKKAKK
ncbi:DNA-directed RNA polymerase [Candidatus Woesearchaeota archaeon]|nr:DNA-directed RNA polymerase [Candidatus Woesearchaeota archaeon]|tara:strand:+ start:4775 stop:5365 length:591 start_codon:yes stop_codon:yes gene_type:complete